MDLGTEDSAVFEPKKQAEGDQYLSEDDLVMISYSWQQQDIALKLYNNLAS